MNPTVKYLLVRVALFLAIGLLLWPTGLHLTVIAMAALLGAFLISFVLPRKLRQDMLVDVSTRMSRRKQAKADLRAALAGDDDE